MLMNNVRKNLPKQINKDKWWKNKSLGFKIKSQAVTRWEKN